MMSPPSKPLALIVDDDAVDRRRIIRLLHHGFEIIEAESLTSALKIYDATPAACVLLDYRLPDCDDLDGVDAFVSRSAAIVLLTGLDSEELGIRALRRGAQEYFTKDEINDRTFVKVVSYAIERRRLYAAHLATLDALREKDCHLREITSRINEGLWLFSARDDSTLFASPSISELFGKPLHRLANMKWREFVHPKDRKDVVSTYQQAKLAKSSYSSQFRILHADGSTRVLRNDGFPVLDANGKLLRITGVVRDITEELRIQSELRTAQKLDSVGHLAAGVAHEIKSPIEYVGDNIAIVSDSLKKILPLLRCVQELCEQTDNSPAAGDLIKRMVESTAEADIESILDKLPEALDQSTYGVEQIKQIVMAMKDFSHPGEDRALADVSQAIRSTATVARNEWKYLADMRLELDEALPAVPCVISSINQALLNLIVNAAHAIDEASPQGQKGSILIRTFADDSDAVIQVKDSGCGMTKQVREKIFDPFFTTKTIGRGTGQGLAIAHEVIVERHGGSISVDSEPGKGACFTIRLPLADSALDVAV